VLASHGLLFTTFQRRRQEHRLASQFNVAAFLIELVDDALNLGKCKRSHTDRNGQLVEVPDWQVRIKNAGREAWFNLGTTNQAAAAKMAKDIFTYLEAKGWDATLAKFKPESNATPRLNLTVGD
jgi:hypothetical protein